MNTYLQWGTVVSVKGNRRGGDVELAYASFLSSGSVSTRVLKEGVLKKKAGSGSLYEKWNERHVTIRGNFLCVGRINYEAQSKVYMMNEIAKGASDTEFMVTCSSSEKLHFRADSAERDVWIKTIRDALDNASSLPHMQEARRVSSNLQEGSRSFHLERRDERTRSSESLEAVARPRFNTTESVVTAEQAIAPEGPSSAADSGTPIAMKSTVAAVKTLAAPPAHAAGPSCSVGVFWDTTTVMAPRQSAEHASGKVREFAEQHGSIEVFKVYREEDVKAGAGKSLRKRMDKDILLWLWDHARKQVSDTLVVLVSDRAFLETLKELAVRGSKVLVVNSHMDKSVACSETTAVEYKLAARVLWDGASAGEQEARSSTAGASKQEACSDDSDLGSDLSSGGSGGFSRAASTSEPRGRAEARAEGKPVAAEGGRGGEGRASTEGGRVGGEGGGGGKKGGLQRGGAGGRSGSGRVSAEKGVWKGGAGQRGGGASGKFGAGVAMEGEGGEGLASGEGLKGAVGGGGGKGALELGLSTWLLVLANVLLAVLVVWST